MSDHKGYAVSIRNEEYEGALELRKIYEVLEDPKATGMQYTHHRRIW